MMTAKLLYSASLMGLLVAAAAIQLRAQDAPPSPPPATIFGPVRRMPPPAPEEFLPRFPQHRSDAERLPWFGSNPDTSTQTARRITPQPGGERPVCPRTVRVDPKIDPQFVQPVPDLGAVIQRVVPPTCVPTTDPIPRP